MTYVDSTQDKLRSAISTAMSLAADLTREKIELEQIADRYEAALREIIGGDYAPSARMCREIASRALGDG